MEKELKNIKFEIEGVTLQKVMSYLSTKPFNEVAGLIQEIQANSKEIKEEVNKK